MKGKRTWLLVIVILVAVAGYFGYQYRQGRSAEAESKAAPVRTVTVARTTIEQRVSASGPVVALNDAQLYFGRAGRIKRLHVSEGQRIPAGTLIAELEADEEELDLLTARRQYETALLEAGPTIIKEREMALRIVEERLERTRLTAPFSGVVVELTAGVGEWITTNNYLVTLIDDSKLFIDATIDEIDIARVKPGQEAVINLVALPGKRIRGQVVEVGKLPRSQSDLVLFPVKIEILNPSDDILLGLSAEVNIITDRRTNVLVVPVEAVLDYQGKQLVSKVGPDGQTTVVEVTTGLSDGRVIEITAGLAEGDVILASNYELYRSLNGPAQHGPNMRVNIPGMRVGR
ncbi:MAG: efflux RND transporter periplasmic adaptor subunit [Firmicutes bacterium]|nr:efflux RND transporter periplasmic adaptor subunit [Bacillota bacterium]